MIEDDRIICNRFLELANNCYIRNIPYNTDFLDLYKQDLFNSILKELPPVCHQVMGGYDLAERKLVQFLPLGRQQADYSDRPYSIIKIAPADRRFSEELTHRDYLGAILNLGITREKLGDLIIDGSEAYLLCINSISDYLLNNITKVKHTFVKVSLVDESNWDYVPAFEEIKGTVASLRLDAVIALGFRTSRNHIISYIEDGRVAVNGRIITSNGYNINPLDIISVRGLGKIKFINTVTETKKGRQMVIINKYI